MKTVLPFSNQYLISTQDITTPIENWKSVKLDNSTLFHAPNLKLTKYQKEELEIILLGFAIHVLNPEWDELQIIEGFPTDENEALNYLDHLCGVHLIILSKQGKTQLYNDAAAVMKMFKFVENDIFKGVASDPKLLQQAFKLEKDESEKALAFYQSDFFINTGIRLGKLTQFNNVEQVLPNHTLSLDGLVTRYFPRESKMNISVDQALDNVHTYFTNIIKAIHRKYSIKCSVTAGWDSRMVLSMTKDFHNDVEYYTFEYPSFTKNHIDYKIPKRISESLGLNHQYHSTNIRLDEASMKTMKASFNFMDTENADVYLSGYSKFMEDKNVLLVGTVSEICKNYYDNVDITDGISLAKAAHFPVIPYTIEYFESKYQELKPLQDKYGYDLRDIAHWEQDITNFAAQRTFYLNAFVRTFSPFNARIIINTILSAPRKLRDKQLHEFYTLYLKKFYPELLKFPVNPSMKQQLIRLGKRVGLYGVYKKLSTRIRK